MNTLIQQSATPPSPSIPLCICRLEAAAAYDAAARRYFGEFAYQNFPPTQPGNLAGILPAF